MFRRPSDKINTRGHKGFVKVAARMGKKSLTNENKNEGLTVWIGAGNQIQVDQFLGGTVQPGKTVEKFGTLIDQKLNFIENSTQLAKSWKLLTIS